MINFFLLTNKDEFMEALRLVTIRKQNRGLKL